MSTIRPAYPQPTPTPQQAPQRPSGGGIFELARAQAAARQTTAAEPIATPAAAPVNRVAQASAEPPQKILRPGSLLDIRV